MRPAPCDDSEIPHAEPRRGSAITTTDSPPRDDVRPPLRRRRDGRVVTGVAGGVAAHLRLPPLAVRLGFVLIATPLFEGLGVLFYVALWAVLPSGDDGERPYRDMRQWPIFALLGAGLIMFAVATNWIGPGMVFAWLAAVVAAGAGVIWHQVKPDGTWVGTLLTDSGRRATFLRIGGGVALVSTGVIGVLVAIIGLNSENLSTMLNSLSFTGIALAGMALVFGPLAWRTVTQLRDEREARVREQERADIAAMVHDQVLHTLALIQRRSDDAREVARLARGQERSLRNWLYKPMAESTERFSAALEAAAAEVEDSFAVTVDTVVVSDCDSDPQTQALVAAAREAMVNAAKHAGVTSISLYAEVESTMTSVFVRDRGAGFDVDNIAADRHGVRGSIVDRMIRHGGRADVRSTVGEGTEVRLWMPREAKGTTDG